MLNQKNMYFTTETNSSNFIPSEGAAELAKANPKLARQRVVTMHDKQVPWGSVLNKKKFACNTYKKKNKTKKTRSSPFQYQPWGF